VLSIVIPVFRNAESLPEVLDVLSDISERVHRDFGQPLEVVFVVDGSPDDSHAILERRLPEATYQARLLLHSRNYGSFAAIRTGLAAAVGDYFAVMAADLQEPSDLPVRFMERLAVGQCDVVVGCRERRSDPPVSRALSNLFWRSYKRLIIPDIPASGVDVFGCNRVFRDKLLELDERNTSLIGLIFWLGFKREEISYVRLSRKHGRSAWTLRKKVDYFLDSVFSFTDLPIRLLTGFGLLGMILATLLGVVVVFAKLSGEVAVPGYAATVLTIIFFGGLNSLGLGIVGAYAWRTFENTKGRPLAVVMNSQTFLPRVVEHKGAV